MRPPLPRRKSKTKAQSPDVTGQARPALRRSPANTEEEVHVDENTTSTDSSTTDESSSDDRDGATPTAQTYSHEGAEGGGVRSDGASPRTPDSHELARLRDAVTKRMLTGQQRAALAATKTLSPGASGKAALASVTGRQPSPLKEESPLASASTTVSSGTQPSSTDSTRTVRGPLPTPSAQSHPLRTPSYPFPYVPGTPKAWTPAFHQPFTVLSPTTSAEPTSSMSRPGTISGDTTPGPAYSAFAPAGPLPNPPSDPRYPSPNLYDIVLQLSAEPSLDAWWTSVTKVLHDCYLADRVSLSLPADANDIENVPWGQKATFNVLGHDHVPPLAPDSGSGHDSHRKPSVATTTQDPCRTIKPQYLRARPGLESRHSYSGAGMVRDQGFTKQPLHDQSIPTRPGMPMRAATHMPSGPRDESLQSIGFSPIHAERQHSLSDPDFSSIGDDRRFIPHISVFSTLRGLDVEDDGLVDASGINRVLERSDMVTLTRDYSLDQEGATPFVSAAKDDGQNTDRSTTLPFRSLFSQPDGRAQRKGSVYEEYEQQPPSTWSQSPAPSPAIQADPEENPFFAEPDSVEDTFNPAAASPDYSNLQAIEAIGVDKATTVTHLPLIHPTLSGTMPPLGEATPSGTDTLSSPQGFRPSNPRRAPIAILSILSPAVPFPPNLTQSLRLLGPHLASSFSNAYQLSAMQSQMPGTRHRRGVLGHGGGAELSSLNPDNLESLVAGTYTDPARSLSGSMTSPSEYSGRSRHSPSSSIGGTPGWELGTGSGRSVSGTPAAHAHAEASDGYFERRRGQLARSESVTSEAMSPLATPHKSGGRSPGLEKSSTRRVVKEEDRRLKTKLPPSKSEMSPLRPHGLRTQSPPRAVDTHSPRRLHFSTTTGGDNDEDTDRRHSFLHSYGADFSSSFQSLPAATYGRGTSSNSDRTSHARTLSSDGQDMPPPSERLLRTIIDSLPVQIFTAAPGTGTLTWVNSKYLVYRGQDSRQVLRDPWDAIHPDDKTSYMEQWNKSLRSGQQLQQKVRIQRFDGTYRWFFVKVAPLKDKKQAIVHWIGTNMDFHDQHTAELNAARQQETATSEAKYRALANSSPQVVFTVNRVKGITFCNSQWTGFSGQTRQQALGLGFMEYVHPDDILKCRLPVFDDDNAKPVNVPTTMPTASRRSTSSSHQSSSASSDTEKPVTSPLQSPPSLGLPQRKLSELAATGILKVTRDSDGKQSYSTEVRLRSKDGEYRWHLVRVVLADAELLAQGQDETWYGTCTDINDHKALERDLKETMDEKSRFLSNMSHEIRTPLNGITGMVNFLIDSNLSEEQMEHVNIIRASTEGLRGLINDILDLSKAEAGMIQLSMDWLHIRSLIEEVNDLTSAMAIDKGLELNYVVEEDVPSQIKGDRFRIRQILLNIVGNAIKFTQKGEVFVRCSVLQDSDLPVGEHEMLINFEVIDTGQGFTEKEADHLFKRFSQIDGSSTRQHGGTGLGLVISKQLAQLHGGDMSAKGYPGKGAIFILSMKGGLPTDTDRPPPSMFTPGVGSLPPTPLQYKAAPPVKPNLLSSVTGKSLQGSPLSSELHRPDLELSRRTSKPSPSISVSSSGSDPSTLASYSSIQSHRSSASSLDPNVVIPAREPLELSLPPNVKPSRGEIQSANPVAKPPARLIGTSPGSPPPMFSILVVCPLKYSREATVRHVDMTLPSTVPHQITARESLLECQKMIGGDEPITFSHVVLILQSVPEITAFMDQLLTSMAQSTTQLIVITDLNQRRQIMEVAPQHDYDALAADRRLRFIFKPLKPSKFAFIFDPQKEREMSTDRNQDSAQQVALTQKQLYDEMKQRLGNKGKRVLLVEDNRVNQMVLLKFLSKVSVQVETVADGALCTDKVFSKAHGYYTIILCDLHMPNKDGYQTCKEIRQWEKHNKYPYLPIIALSANVLGDVYAKCAEAGFNSYVTKPVDFKELATAMLTFMDPSDPEKPIEFMKPKKK